MRLPIRISVTVTPWSRTRSEIALKLVSARTTAMSVRTHVCIRPGSITKPRGATSRRIGGLRLDLDQAPGMRRNDGGSDSALARQKVGLGKVDHLVAPAAHDRTQYPKAEALDLLERDGRRHRQFLRRRHDVEHGRTIMGEHGLDRA